MRSSVSCGRGVAATAVEEHAHVVTGSGQGTLSQTDLTDVQARVAVQGEDRVDALHGPVGDGVVGAAGDDLLGCLEDRPHGDPALAQFVLVGGQGEHGTEQRRRVDVVAAGVTDTRVRRREVEAGALPDRQRVDVSAQGDAITRLPDRCRPPARSPGTVARQARPRRVAR